METNTNILARFDTSRNTSFRYGASPLLRACGLLFVLFSGTILWGKVPGLAPNNILAYLYMGGFAALGIAITLGKSFLPQDISDGSEVEFRFGILASAAALSGLLLIGNVVVDYHHSDALTNLIVLVLGLFPLALLFRINGDNAKVTVLALCGGLYVISVWIFLFAGIGWLYGPKGYEVYLPVAVAFCIIGFESGNKVDVLTEYIALRTSRVPARRSFARSLTLLFLASLVLCVPLAYTFIDALNPIVWNLSWPLIEVMGNDVLVMNAVTVLYLSEVIGAAVGFITGLVKARHRPIECKAYWTVMKCMIKGLVGAFIICASIPMFLLYGIVYLVALAMAAAVLYVAFVM